MDQQTEPFEFQPVHIDPKAEPPKPERIPVFYIGEEEYTALKKIDARTALRMLRIGSERGSEAMAWSLLEIGLGRDTIDKLIECPAVDDEQVKTIFSQLTTMYLSQVRSLGK
jgi:hypothetical protein